LVRPFVSKHHIFAFVRAPSVIAAPMVAITTSRATAFAVLQSRVHEAWARLLSSSMKGDLRYAASDCFETFPFPTPEPRSELPALELLGERFHAVRAKYATDENVGLTTTYNRMKDRGVTDARVEELRQLTVTMDRAVLAAYGWADLEPPRFTTPVTDDEKRESARFEDTVIDRLFARNAELAKSQGAARGATACQEGDESETALAEKDRAPKAKAPRARRKRSTS
jgi:hypothetical protein